MKSKLIRIYSENATFQLLEALRRNRERRQKQHEFLVEGVRQINLAVQRGWTINAWLYSPERNLSDWASSLLAQAPAPIHYELAAPLLAKLSGKEEASELLALVAMPEDNLARIPIRPQMLILLFDRPANPGNLGTLLRSADSLGADGLVITGHAADLYDPETISASVGTLFTLPVVRVAAPRALEPWFDQIRQQIGPFLLVGSSAKATLDLSEHDWTGPTLLVIGNETAGMSAHYRALCDVTVKIPMDGAASSLNVACAASIMLYEIQRQRRRMD